MKGYVYILKCSNDQYYTGSTININERVANHFEGKGANFTKKYPPIKLVYIKGYQNIEEAFRREKQIQGWSRKKKEALINNNENELSNLSKCQNISHFKNFDIQ